ncbi:hypothetical protein ACFE04_014557 [Oxalis oulophora]
MRPYNDPHHHHHRAAAPPARSHLLEDRIAIQHREIQTLLMENQRLAATVVVLKQDFAISQQEIRQLSAAATDVKADRDGEIRRVYDTSLKMDDKVREVNAMSLELDQVRNDIKRLSVMKQEMTAQLLTANGDLERTLKDVNRVPVVKAEIDAVIEEIKKGRIAIECEKKNRETNNEHCKVMEKNTIALAREIERLRAELESKARAGFSYATNYGGPEMVYAGGALYPGPYGMHQVQGVPGSMPQAPYVIQKTEEHT